MRGKYDVCMIEEKWETYCPAAVAELQLSTASTSMISDGNVRKP